jgi:RHS repeat-associated protein
VALVNSSGNVVDRYEYDAYGSCSVYDGSHNPRSQPSDGNPYLFTGRRVDFLDDGNLVLQYNRNRYYDYYLGRWLTHDPFGINPAAGKPNPFSIRRQYMDGVNLYEYVRSNVPSLSDPTAWVAFGPVASYSFAMHLYERDIWPNPDDHIGYFRLTVDVKCQKCETNATCCWKPVISKKLKFPPAKPQSMGWPNGFIDRVEHWAHSEYWNYEGVDLLYVDWTGVAWEGGGAGAAAGGGVGGTAGAIIGGFVGTYLLPGPGSWKGCLIGGSIGGGIGGFVGTKIAGSDFGGSFEHFSVYFCDCNGTVHKVSSHATNTYGDDELYWIP